MNSKLTSKCQEYADRNDRVLKVPKNQFFVNSMLTKKYCRSDVTLWKSTFLLAFLGKFFFYFSTNLRREGLVSKRLAKFSAKNKSPIFGKTIAHFCATCNEASIMGCCMRNAILGRFAIVALFDSLPKWVTGWKFDPPS